jgi:hypothetical protein
MSAINLHLLEYPKEDYGESIIEESQTRPIDADVCTSNILEESQTRPLDADVRTSTIQEESQTRPLDAAVHASNTPDGDNTAPRDATVFPFPNMSEGDQTAPQLEATVHPFNTFDRPAGTSGLDAAVRPSMTLEGANTRRIDAAVRLSPRPEGANTESQIELEATVRPSPTE